MMKMTPFPTLIIITFFVVNLLPNKIDPNTNFTVLGINIRFLINFNKVKKFKSFLSTIQFNQV